MITRPRDNEELEPARVRDRDRFARLPVLEAHLLVAVVEQDGRGACAGTRLDLLALTRSAHDLGLIAIAVLPQAHEDGAAALRGRDMRGARWVAEITAGRIVAMFVLKSTVQHENLLAATVRVAGKSTPGSIAHDRGGAGDLAADAEQHAPVDARRRAGHPIQLRGVDDNGFRQIVVNAHGLAPSRSKPRN